MLLLLIVLAYVMMASVQPEAAETCPSTQQMLFLHQHAALHRRRFEEELLPPLLQPRVPGKISHG